MAALGGRAACPPLPKLVFLNTIVATATSTCTYLASESGSHAGE